MKKSVKSKVYFHFIKWKIHLNNFYYKNRILSPFEPFRILWIKQQTATMERRRMTVGPTNTRVIESTEEYGGVGVGGGDGSVEPIHKSQPQNALPFARENDWNRRCNVFYKAIIHSFYFAYFSLLK